MVYRYHGVKQVESIQKIYIEGFRRGEGQAHKDDNNINPLSNKLYPKCEEGVYFTPNISEAKTYTSPIT